MRHNEACLRIGRLHGAGSVAEGAGTTVPAIPHSGVVEYTCSRRETTRVAWIRRAVDLYVRPVSRRRCRTAVIAICVAADGIVFNRSDRYSTVRSSQREKLAPHDNPRCLTIHLDDSSRQQRQRRRMLDRKLSTNYIRGPSRSPYRIGLDLTAVYVRWPRLGHLSNRRLRVHRSWRRHWLSSRR